MSKNHLAHLLGGIFEARIVVCRPCRGFPDYPGSIPAAHAPGYHLPAASAAGSQIEKVGKGKILRPPSNSKVANRGGLFSTKDAFILRSVPERECGKQGTGGEAGLRRRER